MATRKPTTKRTETSRLGPDDWLDAAFEAVVEGGFDNVRVLAIADSLGVTRGSFYWHFADHADLVRSLLERWRGHELGEIRRLQDETSDDPEADLARLLDVALARSGDDLKDMRFELALRGLGRRDPSVAKMLVEIDEARMGLFREKFGRLTGEARSSADLAALFYLAITGANQAIARPSSTARIAEYLKGLIADYLIRRQAPKRPARGSLSPAARPPASPSARRGPAASASTAARSAGKARRA
jgi:AcrR family transcriptional regulator